MLFWYELGLAVGIDMGRGEGSQREMRNRALEVAVADSGIPALETQLEASFVLSIGFLLLQQQVSLVYVW